MNVLDELLADTGQVEHLPAGALQRGRSALEEAVGALHPHRRLPRRRLVGLSLASVAGVAAAAAAVVALTTGLGHSATSHDAHSGPTATGSSTGVPKTVRPTLAANTIELAGYQITLPADYQVGKAIAADDTNCSAALHLSADETKRLITTPSPGCPVLIASVERTRPPDANPFRIGRPGYHGTVYGWTSDSTQQMYLPVKLPDGTTVYVSLHGSTIGANQADFGFYGTDYNASQLAELEQGMQVTPSSALPTYTHDPAPKPTVNCTASCGH